MPFEPGGREIWISISGVEFDDGVVFAFRNLTEERALDELKDEFVATVSHELNTPLAAIYGAAQTLRREDLELDPETRRQLLEVIATESERLARIVNEILLASSARLRPARARQPSAVDLFALAGEVVEEMRAIFADRDGLQISLPQANGQPAVVADPDRLRQVLINLLDNAVKYSPDGGRVAVEIEPRAHSVRVAIRDEGIGIPRGEQRRIFGKFYRVDPQLSRGVGGTGLGLYICRELVRRMQGRVWVASNEGEGSTFYVDLPLAEAPVPASVA